MKSLELTLALLKPDLCMRVKAKEEVMAMIRESNFFIIRQAVIKITPNKAHEFYAEHTGKFFFERLVEFMCVHPVQAMILAHPYAIQHWRTLMGPTKAYIAQNTAPNTIRGMYGLTDTRNSVHGSACAKSAEREIGIFFPDFVVGRWYQSEETFQSGKVTFCAKQQIHIPTEIK